MDELQKYSISDIEFCINKFYEETVDNMNRSEIPKGYILGGQSGAGKTTLHRMICEVDKNAVVINADEFRQYHPHYKELVEKYDKESVNYTQPFINAVTNTLIDKLSNEKYNIIVEGTCRRAEVPLKTCNDLKEKGYSTELMIICTNKEIAWQSTIDRYNAMEASGEIPRAVPRDKYEETVRALPNNVNELYKSGSFDEITLFNRDRECLYRMSDTPNISPGAIVNDVLNNGSGSYRSAYEEGYAQAEKKFKKQAEKAYEQGRQESRQEIYADLNSMSTDELLKFFGRDASEITQSNGNSNNNNDGRGGRR